MTGGPHMPYDRDETLRDDQGASSVEYGLLIGLIAIVIFVAVVLLGENTRDLFSTAATMY
jgi:pilus assembly protein Flp/PilA